MQLQLTGEQNRVLSLPIQNPVQIKGVAGSGKTTVAVYRARHVAASFNDMYRKSKVHIFSYNKNLVKFIGNFLTSPAERECIQVTTVHSWAYQLLKRGGFWQINAVAQRGAVNGIILRLLTTLKLEHPECAILTKSLEFYVQEISWLKGRRIFSKQDYLDAKRSGRGTQDRVTAADKELLWQLYAECRRIMRERKIVDYDDFANIALAYIEKSPNFKPPFSHIVVDEAQDLNPSQLLLISKLVNPETNSITIVADAAQKIYKSGFSWSDIGINVRGGRSVEFKCNYRNTRQIAEAALSLLAHDPQPGEFSAHILPEREGPLPEIAAVESFGAQLEFLIQGLRSVDLSSDSFVVLHRSNQGVDNLSAALLHAGFNPVKIKESSGSDLKASGLYVCTMSSIKGLECDHVALCDLNDGLLPYAKGFEGTEDEQHIMAERRLLYTCMTRARKTVLMISTAAPSRYIAEIEASKLRRIR